jgi:hypothetical protein
MEDGAVRLAMVGAGANSVAPLAGGRRWCAVRYADEAEAGRRVIAHRADQDAPRRKQRRVLVVFASGRDDRDRDAPHSLCPPLPRVRRGLNLPGLPKPRHPPPRRARVRQNMSALIRDEYGSQALFLAVTAAVRIRVAKKNYTSRTTLQHLSQTGFLHFSLRTDRAARLCGKALRQDFDSSFESRAWGWPTPSRRAEKMQNRRTAVEPVAQGFFGSCKIVRCKSLAHRLFFCATPNVTLSAKCA